MKHFPRVFIIGVCAVLLPSRMIRAESPAAAANPERVNPGPREYLPNLLMVLEVYAVPREEARATLETKLGSADRYRNILDLERNGKARLEILTALTTKSGQRAVTEAIDEVRYPSEFAPGKSHGDAPVATAFEVRNVGDTFEVEPALDPDRLHCSLNLVPQRVSFAGFRDVPGNADDPPGAQPVFATQKLTTSSQVALDQVHYLGTFSPAAGKARAGGESAPEIWFAFVNVHRVSSERAAGKSKMAGGDLIEMEYSFYSLDREAARDLLSTAPNLATPWERLQDLLRENKARFERIQSLKTKSGQRAVVEEASETRFGTEYALPGVRKTRETTTHTVTPAGPAANKPGQGPPPATQETTTVEREIPNSDGSPGAFTAFETRDTGAIVEVEPAVGPDGALVDANNVVQSLLDLGSLEVNGAATAFPAQPVFEVRKLTTSLTTRIGDHTLVGTLSMPGANGVNGRVDSGRTWLVFLRATPDAP